jgi:hypothetical protein
MRDSVGTERKPSGSGGRADEPMERLRMVSLRATSEPERSSAGCGS